MSSALVGSGYGGGRECVLRDGVGLGDMGERGK
jgi:hypothetical protein